jgi:hypothetical protein
MRICRREVDRCWVIYLAASYGLSALLFLSRVVLLLLQGGTLDNTSAAISVIMALFLAFLVFCLWRKYGPARQSPA